MPNKQVESTIILTCKPLASNLYQISFVGDIPPGVYATYENKILGTTFTVEGYTSAQDHPTLIKVHFPNESDAALLVLDGQLRSVWGCGSRVDIRNP